jgi:hypothetical protein
MRHPYPDVVLGDMVRELRLDSGRGVAELAKDVSWPIGRLRALEEGAGGVSFTEFIPLVRLFGLDLEEFTCEFLTNLEESHVDFRQLELDLADAMAADDFDEDEYLLHD